MAPTLMLLHFLQLILLFNIFWAIFINDVFIEIKDERALDKLKIDVSVSFRPAILHFSLPSADNPVLFIKVDIDNFIRPVMFMTHDV